MQHYSNTKDWPKATKPAPTLRTFQRFRKVASLIDAGKFGTAKDVLELIERDQLAADIKKHARPRRFNADSKTFLAFVRRHTNSKGEFRWLELERALRTHFEMWGCRFIDVLADTESHEKLVIFYLAFRRGKRQAYSQACWPKNWSDMLFDPTALAIELTDGLIFAGVPRYGEKLEDCHGQLPLPIDGHYV